MAGLRDSDTRQQRLRPAARYQRLVLLLSRPRAALGIAAVAFVLSLPALTIGLAADDFDLALAVTEHPLSAYAFQARDPTQRQAYLLAAREAGSAPWWIDLAFHQAFLRPLSSLSLALFAHRFSRSAAALPRACASTLQRRFPTHAYTLGKVAVSRHWRCPSSANACAYELRPRYKRVR
jgi:hypothetical protein